MFRIETMQNPDFGVLEMLFSDPVSNMSRKERVYAGEKICKSRKPFLQGCFPWSRISGWSCMWTQNHGFCWDFASIWIEIICFFRNFINFIRNSSDVHHPNKCASRFYRQSLCWLPRFPRWSAPGIPPVSTHAGLGEELGDWGHPFPSAPHWTEQRTLGKQL